MASCGAKRRRFISNKEKTRRMTRTSWTSNLRKTEKETEFAPVIENNLLDENKIVNLQEIMRQLLQGCSDCGNELKLTRLISETKSGLDSYLYISCECGVINTICSGKRHPETRYYRFFITRNDYFQTHFVAPALTRCNMGIRSSVCSSVRSCVRQAVNICDHPSVNPLNVQIHFC